MLVLWRRKLSLSVRTIISFLSYHHNRFLTYPFKKSIFRPHQGINSENYINKSHNTFWPAEKLLNIAPLHFNFISRGSRGVKIKKGIYDKGAWYPIDVAAFILSQTRLPVAGSHLYHYTYSGAHPEPFSLFRWAFALFKFCFFRPSKNTSVCLFWNRACAYRPLWIHVVCLLAAEKYQGLIHWLVRVIVMSSVWSDDENILNRILETLNWSECYTE